MERILSKFAAFFIIWSFAVLCGYLYTAAEAATRHAPQAIHVYNCGKLCYQR